MKPQSGRVSGLRRVLCAAGLCLVGSSFAGCGGMSGTWKEAEGDDKVEFRSGGRMYLTIMGSTVAGQYETDGDRVILRTNNQAIVLVRDGDTLQGGAGAFNLKFVRVDRGIAQ